MSSHNKIARLEKEVLQLKEEIRKLRIQPPQQADQQQADQQQAEQDDDPTETVV